MLYVPRKLDLWWIFEYLIGNGLWNFDGRYSYFAVVGMCWWCGGVPNGLSNLTTSTSTTSIRDRRLPLQKLHEINDEVVFELIMLNM
jgi:hypothetical protein